jgi:hypothetical protein
MEEKPTREFGTRKPVATHSAAPVKRSGHVALLLMGTFTIGGGAYALMPRENCEPGTVTQTGGACASRGSSSSGGYGSWGTSSQRNNLVNGDSATNRSAAGASPDSGSSNVTRGGFGSLARAFAAHFSGG